MPSRLGPGRTVVMGLDGPPQAGKTYRINPDNGRLIEGTTFRPAWRPYRGIEGEVTVLSVSKAGVVRAAIRVTTLTLRQSEEEQRMSGIFSFKPVGPDDAFLSEAQLRVGGMSAAMEPKRKKLKKNAPVARACRVTKFRKSSNAARLC